jgi:hypothetical protein
MRLAGVDWFLMKQIPDSDVTESSDQQLVDLYTVHAGDAAATEMTDIQIHGASQAAYDLELRGYIEQAGIWLHDDRPALQATA